MSKRMMANAASPEAYLAALKGWRRELVDHLRDHVLAAAKVEEGIRYGNLFYSSNGPAVVIRAEDKRVLLAFFRGKRLLDIEPRLKASGSTSWRTCSSWRATRSPQAPYASSRKKPSR